jgi:hypothetical protein
MVLKINVWRSGLESLAEKDLPMTEFLRILSQKFSLENPIAMKRNPMLNQR